MTHTNDLHDYTLAAWSLDQSDWMMVLDIENPPHTVRQEFKGVVAWNAESLRSAVGVLEMTVWEVDHRLLENPQALQSWNRLFGFSASSNNALANSKTLIEQYKGKALILIETVDGGTLDLICHRLTQNELTKG